MGLLELAELPEPECSCEEEGDKGGDATAEDPHRSTESESADSSQSER